MKIPINQGLVLSIALESKYINEIANPSNQLIINQLYRDVICEIGRNFANDIKGNNSHQHKGIKKIVMHARTKYGALLTNREIKCLFNSEEKRYIRRKTKIKTLVHTHVIKCPYLVCTIIKSIVDLSQGISSISLLIDEYSEEIENKKVSCIALYIPEHVSIIKTSVLNVQNYAARTKGNLLSKKRIVKLLKLQEDIDMNFSKPCY